MAPAFLKAQTSVLNTIVQTLLSVHGAWLGVDRILHTAMSGNDSQEERQEKKRLAWQAGQGVVKPCHGCFLKRLPWYLSRQRQWHGL